MFFFFFFIGAPNKSEFEGLILNILAWTVHQWQELLAEDYSYKIFPNRVLTVAINYFSVTSDFVYEHMEHFGGQ